MSQSNAILLHKHAYQMSRHSETSAQFKREKKEFCWRYRQDISLIRIHFIPLNRTAHSTINTRNDQMFKHFIDLQSKYGKTTVEWIWMDYRIFCCLWVSALILNIISVDTGRTSVWENSFSCQNMCSIQHHPMTYTVGCIQHQTISNSDYMIFIIANISKIHHHLTNFTNEMEFRPISDRRHHAKLPLSLLRQQFMHCGHFSEIHSSVTFHNI